MKKLVTGLAAALMLAGCAPAAVPATETTEPPQAETAASTAPTESPAINYYVPDSPMERSTGGAVKVYRMDGSVTGLAMLGENLLVCTDGRTLHLLGGPHMDEIRTREVDTDLAWGSADLRVTEDGVAYFDGAQSTYVTLDTNLVTGPSYVVPGENPVKPLISSDLSAIYYVTEEGIQVMNLQEGTSRILRQEHEQIVRLGGLMFENSILYYTRRGADGTEQTCFVDAESGSLSRTNEFQGQMVSRGTHFNTVMKVDHALGQDSWVITGNKYGRLHMLDLEEGWGNPILLENGYVVLQKLSRVGLGLSCFDMVTEQQVARVTLPQQNTLFAYGGVGEHTLWLCDGSGGRFYGWNLRIHPEGEPAAQLREYASLEAPDSEEMAQVEREAEALGERLGIRIRFARGDNRTSGVDYREYPDFLPTQYRAAMAKLLSVVEKLPEGMLARIGRNTDGGKLEIELVDSYDPAFPPKPGTGSYSVEGGVARISVPMSSALEPIFYHELFHVMEVRIRNAGDGLKDWASLNPEGFEYTGAAVFVPSEGADTNPYLIFGQNVAADEDGLLSGREDRAQLFMYACMDGQRERLESPVMQAKLRKLSGLIRGTFGLRDAALWEQYLLPDPPEPTEPDPGAAPTDPSEASEPLSTATP